MEMRSALIVGAGSGLSASLARLFARNGLFVLVGGRRACVLDGHETYSLRRHYPVTGSAVDAAATACRRFM